MILFLKRLKHFNTSPDKLLIISLNGSSFSRRQDLEMNSRANDVVDDNDDKSLIWIESYRNIPNFRASSQYGT